MLEPAVKVFSRQDHCPWLGNPQLPRCNNQAQNMRNCQTCAPLDGSKIISRISKHRFRCLERDVPANQQAFLASTDYPPRQVAPSIWEFAPKRYPKISSLILRYPKISLNSNKSKDMNYGYERISLNGYHHGYHRISVYDM